MTRKLTILTKKTPQRNFGKIRIAKLSLNKNAYRLLAFFLSSKCKNIIHIGIPKDLLICLCSFSVLAGEHRPSCRNIVMFRSVRTEERRRRFHPGRGFRIDEIRPHRKCVNPCQNRISNVWPEKQALSVQVFRHTRLVLCVDRYVVHLDGTNPSDREAY